MIAALGGRFDADEAEAEVIERALREYGGTMPDAQLIAELAWRWRSSGGADSSSPVKITSRRFSFW